MKSLKHLLFVIFFFLIFIFGPCSVVKFPFPTIGIVVDKSSGQPIGDAKIERNVSIGYLDPGGGSYHDLLIDQYSTNKKGEFVSNGGLHLVFPLNVGLKNEFTTIAPGYWPLDNIEFSRYSIYQKIELHKIRYYLPLYYYSNGILESWWRSEFDIKKSIEESNLYKKIKSYDFAILSPPGVFTSVDGAEFIKIIVDRDNNTVKAFDNKSGQFYEWDHYGTFKRKYSENSLDFESRSEKVNRLKQELLEFIDKSRNYCNENKKLSDRVKKNVQEKRKFIRALINKDTSNFEWAGKKNKYIYDFLLRKNKHISHYHIRLDSFSYIPEASGIRITKSFERLPNVSWVEIPKNMITTGTHVNRNLYLAFKKEGIFKLGSYIPGRKPIPNDDKFIANPITFLDLQKWSMSCETCSDSESVLYTVSGDNNIYRFGLDGTLDMRIDTNTK